MARSGFVVILPLVGFAAAGSDKCYVLALEGGGTHGAYEAGVLYSITNNLPADEVRWNVISGISTGSLNAGQCAQFAYGDEQNMAEHLIQTWLLIQNQNMIAPPWPGSVFHRLFFDPSLYNTAPLRSFLGTRMGTTIQRNVTVGTTDMTTGQFMNFDESLGAADLISAVMCSAAPPFAFPPIHFQGNYFSDGACTLNLDGFAGIKRCYEMGYDYSNIVVDLILDDWTNALNQTFVYTTEDVINRVNQITKYYATYWYLTQLITVYDEVQYRFNVTPSVPLPPVGQKGVALDFNPDDMQYEISVGKNDGLNAVYGIGEGFIQKLFMGESNIHYF